MIKKLIFLSTVVICVSGCASLFQLFGEQPKAELREVFLKDANLFGATLIFVVNVANPNSFDISVQEIDYKVFLSGKEFSTAKIEKAVSVPAKKDANIEIPLPVKFGSLWAHLSEALNTKTLVYRIEGNAKMSFATIPFSKDGKMELQ